jgi:hypothetical protein
MLHVDLNQIAISDGFTAAGLRGELDPFISVDNFLMTQPTVPPHPHAGFNELSYRHQFVEKECDMNRRFEPLRFSGDST